MNIEKQHLQMQEHARAIASDAYKRFPLNLDGDSYGKNENAYLRALRDIAEHGRIKMSRPGIATLSLPATRMEIDLTDGKIPLLRSKKIFHESFTTENKWFLQGSSNVRFLKDQGVGIWDSWVKPETAVWEPTDKPTGSDTETYMRCFAPTLYKTYFQPWKDATGLTFPTTAQINQFFNDWVNTPRESLAPRDPKLAAEVEKFAQRPMLRLAAGEIGKGAYGPAWRDWKDVRFISADDNDPENFQNRGFQALDVQHFKGAYWEDNAEYFSAYTRTIDQMGDAVKMLRNGADSRRIIVSAWNPALIDETVLPPCHTAMQFISYDNFNGGPRDLVCMMWQRSCDRAVGGPFNMAQYAMLTHLIAHITNHRAVKLVINVGDDHIYANQVPYLAEQFSRTPIWYNSPQFILPPEVKELEDFIGMSKSESTALIKGYEEGTYHPRINYPVAV